MSPTQRTMNAVRKLGYKPWIVERFISFAPPHGKRIDLFNIIDIIALTPKGVLGIQCCGVAYSQHLKKILKEEEENTIAWLKTPGTSLELWGWRKLKKKPGGKAMVYKPRVARITLEGKEWKLKYYEMENSTE